VYQVRFGVDWVVKGLMFMRIAGNSDWKGERQGRGMGYGDEKLYSESEF